MFTIFNTFYSLYFFIQRKINLGFDLKKEELVLDIGSGDKPFWRADVFLDRLDMDNNQRISNQDTIHDLGMFVNGDASKMPFKDKVFDFSFCSHLLEHVDDPAKVLKEITRVSKKGIERAKRFTWKKMAKEVITVLEKI